MVLRNPLAEGFDLKTSPFFTLNNGEIVTSDWAHQEVVKRLPKMFSIDERRSMASLVISPNAGTRTMTITGLVDTAIRKFS